MGEEEDWRQSLLPLVCIGTFPNESVNGWDVVVPWIDDLDNS